MADYVTIGQADEVAEGDAAAFEVEGTEIAVARVDGNAATRSATSARTRVHADAGRRARRHRAHLRVSRQHVLDRDR